MTPIGLMPNGLSDAKSASLERAKQLAATLLSKRGEASRRAGWKPHRPGSAFSPRQRRTARADQRLGNTELRAIQEFFGIMVNDLYDHDSIENTTRPSCAAAPSCVRSTSTR